jgi:D-alanyl-D-alanine carboxypeptidase
LLWLALAPVAALGAVLVVDRLFFATSRTAAVPIRPCRVEAARSSRTELQRILDGVVAGRGKIAPGATAFVSGPHGTWSGAAGVDDLRTCEPMRVDARMRLESVSKIYTAALVEQLAEQGRLHVGDTVERWLPGLLPYGSRITIRQLLTMTSGLIDNNDFGNASDSVRRTYLARIKNPRLRAKLLAAAAQIKRDPSTTVPATLWVEWAAWQPLLFTPGGGFHYSNIGYEILGLIAERASGTSLPELYRDRIVRPLDLHATAYDPQGPIGGPHAHGYGIEPDGTTLHTTSWHAAVGAEGGIVSNARETATFLTALMRGRLVPRTRTLAIWTPPRRMRTWPRTPRS